MAFNIPDKAFLSFGRKQCLDTLWRIGRQMDEHWHNEKERLASLAALERYLGTLREHSSDYIQQQAQKLHELFPTDQVSMQNWLMYLEREMGQDVKDSDFLISTEDTDEVKNFQPHPVHLVLDNLRSSFNVGSLFRSAEAFGASEIHLCGYTPTPENSKTAKSALGTDHWIKWRYWENTLDCLDWLKSEGITSYALETEANAIELEKINNPNASAIVLGNERYGLGEPVLKKCDFIVKVNLSGRKNSLNVGTCGAIALHHICSQFN